MNALDKRTYMPFVQAGATLTPEERKERRAQDLNSIPHVERRHFCYVRGLAFDLIKWFFDNYDLQRKGMTLSDGYFTQAVPLVVATAREMIRYKLHAEAQGILGCCSSSAFQRQIEWALFGFDGFEEQYKLRVADERHKSKTFPDLDDPLRLWFVMPDDRVVRLEKARGDGKGNADYFNAGKNRADNRYFFAVKGMCFAIPLALLIVERYPQALLMQRLIHPTALLRVKMASGVLLTMSRWHSTRKCLAEQIEGYLHSTLPS